MITTTEVTAGYRPLSELSIGSKGIIQHIDGNTLVKNCVLSWGVRPYLRIIVLRKLLRGIEVLSGDKTVLIDEEAAKRIIVKEESYG